MANRAWRLTVPSLLLALVASSEASASYVGDRFFPSTLATVVPTPADFINFPQLTQLPDTASHEVDFPFSYSKLITPDWSVSFTANYRKIDQGSTRAGFDNLVLGTQYELYSNAEHEFVLSAGGTLALGGTGSSEIGAKSFSTLTPTVYVGKGFGDLSDSMAWLRPVNVTATLGVALPTESTTVVGAARVDNPNILQWGFALEYSLLTNSYSAGKGDAHRFAEGLVPLVEFAMQTPLDGPSAGETTGTINPGVIWVGEYGQLGVEAIIPINESSGRDIGVRAQLHFYLGNIFSNAIGKPIFD
ncbi:hypothetical protein [Mesorhizobium sanjuanii]|uniref:hypothetical protein n=1 Tax=Mesorhizobium sanjuanii TaxID=2037900 RepID=UPI0010554245|nr:hypothetical protein [Mesorhizobium sanjuanii]